MHSIDPDAIWVQMGWTFYYMKLWKDDPARLQTMIKAVPENRMIILDYFAEQEEVWRNTQAWHGAPYIWCYLGNFGGNTEMAPQLRKLRSDFQKLKRYCPRKTLWHRSHWKALV